MQQSYEKQNRFTASTGQLAIKTIEKQKIAESKMY